MPVSPAAAVMGQLSPGQVHCFLTFLPFYTYDNEQYERRVRGGDREGTGGCRESTGGSTKGERKVHRGCNEGARWVQEGCRVRAERAQGYCKKSTRRVQGWRKEDAEKVRGCREGARRSVQSKGGCRREGRGREKEGKREKRVQEGGYNFFTLH